MTDRHIVGIDPLPEAHQRVVERCVAEAWRNHEQNDPEAQREQDVAADIVQHLYNEFGVVASDNGHSGPLLRTYVGVNRYLQAWPQGEKPSPAQQIDYLIASVAMPADVNQRQADLQTLARLVNEHPEACYGVVPFDHDSHAEDCIVCFGADAGPRIRDGHPYLSEVALDEDGNLLADLGEQGFYYLGPLEPAKRLLRDSYAEVREYTKEGGIVVVGEFLSGDDEPSSWGASANGRWEEAWRFFAGTSFGPVDAEYDEAHLRQALQRPQRWIVHGTSMEVEALTAEEAVQRAEQQSGWHWEATPVADDKCDECGAGTSVPGTRRHRDSCSLHPDNII